MQMASLVNVVNVNDRTVRCNLSPCPQMGDSVVSVLLPELSGETWVAATHLDEVTGDLPPSGSEADLITASRIDKTLITVREWVRTGSLPSWSDCGGLSPELRSWHLQFENLMIDFKIPLEGVKSQPGTLRCSRNWLSANTLRSRRSGTSYDHLQNL